MDTQVSMMSLECLFDVSQATLGEDSWLGEGSLTEGISRESECSREDDLDLSLSLKQCQ